VYRRAPRRGFRAPPSAPRFRVEGGDLSAVSPFGSRQPPPRCCLFWDNKIGVFATSVQVGLDSDQSQSQLGVETDHVNVDFVTGFEAHFDHIRTKRRLAVAAFKSTP
jgi:hypothetical protein